MGHGQHTMVSCDDGLTWKQNKYTNEIVVGSDTDHIPFGLRGSAYANGAFYAMWGWGTNTYIERSTDGVNWQAIFGVADPNARSSTTYDPAFRYWGWGLLALDDGRVLFANDADIHLLNSGATAWTHITLATAFNKPILGYANGTFVMHPEGGGYYTSADGQGLTQWAPAITVPNECKGGRTSKILFNNAVLALPAADMNGEYVCSSMDAGQTWRSKKVSPDIWPDSGLIYDGARFLSTAARPLEMNASQDAWNWQPVIKDNSVDWLTVYGANQATGTIIVAQGSDIQSTDSNGNPVKYQGSALYRSSNNGLSFQKLPDNAYDKHGGTIISILSGKVTSSAACGN